MWLDILTDNHTGSSIKTDIVHQISLFQFVSNIMALFQNFALTGRIIIQTNDLNVPNDKSVYFSNFIYIYAINQLHMWNKG